MPKNPKKTGENWTCGMCDLERGCCWGAEGERVGLPGGGGGGGGAEEERE